MPKGMSQLKNLQFLSDYVVGKREENKITELGALADLHQSISIAGLENVVNSSEASMARMFDKDGICSLELSWSPDEDENEVDSQIERDILDKLQPHTNLKELEIRGYRGTTFSDWLGSSSYRNITYLRLDGCRNCCMLPSFGQLPSLKGLRISNFESVEIVGAEFYFYQNDESCLETPFPKLESLSFSSMPCWKEWRSMELNAFPRLRKLTIMECPMLRGDLPNQLPSLQSLWIEKCVEVSCCVPRAPAITTLSISGKHLVGSVVEAITNTQLTCLTSLWISGCSSHIWFPVSAIPPSLHRLTIQECRELEFEMDGQHHSLQELYIRSSCDSLASFSLLDSFPNLVRVEIMYCRNMESIVVSRSLSCLRYLWINHCGSLKSVSTIWMAAPQLQRLSLVGCPEVDLSPTGDGDPHRSLGSLEISYCEKLVSTAAFMNSQFQGLIDLWIEGECESVKCLPKEGWLPASLESLTLEGIKSVETLECKGLAHLTSLHELSIYECPKLENMEGEKLPASLIQLSVSRSPLLGKRCEMKDLQLWPKISHIPAIRVDNRWIW
ncbi:putative disease resistance protein RGA3 [Arachis stenosperma]|uniref:putative disease resistance protein RGA3 n=1 Tax=Arachis stenosperma TaxID=217475 RepID=UPI0025AD165B|nr:putative disease resistance protein RGA3 [Arachis stenosperma]XP_057745684.1 putative disease resistance protein RGA3 [Arachis stenosperma]